MRRSIVSALCVALVLSATPCLFANDTWQDFLDSGPDPLECFYCTEPAPDCGWGPIMEGACEDNLPDGMWIGRTFEGDIVVREEWAQGVRTGMWSAWYETGAKKWEGRYVDGAKDGEWVWYFPDGVISQRGTYRDGVEDGLWLAWYDAEVVLTVYERGAVVSEDRKPVRVRSKDFAEGSD